MREQLYGNRFCVHRQTTALLCVIPLTFFCWEVVRRCWMMGGALRPRVRTSACTTRGLRVRSLASSVQVCMYGVEISSRLRRALFWPTKRCTWHGELEICTGQLSSLAEFSGLRGISLVSEHIVRYVRAGGNSGRQMLVEEGHMGRT